MVINPFGSQLTVDRVPTSVVVIISRCSVFPSVRNEKRLVLMVLN